MKYLIIIVFQLFLIGCSGEPSESNMLSAVQRNDNIKMQLSFLIGMANNFNQSANANKPGSSEELVKNIIESMELEKSACVEASGLPGYVCDFRTQLTVNDKKEWNNPTKGRFFKAGDGWNYEEVK